MTFPILASLLVRLVVLLPFQLLRLSLSTTSRWTPFALSVLLHCVVALILTPSVFRMSLHIFASLLVILVVLLPFQRLRLSLAAHSRWTPLALSVFLHCVVALLLTLL